MKKALLATIISEKPCGTQQEDHGPSHSGRCDGYRYNHSVVVLVPSWLLWFFFVVVVGLVVVVVVLLVVVVVVVVVGGVGLRVVVVLGGSVGPEVGTAVMLEYSAFQTCS